MTVFWQFAFLGLLQGLTEFLPVSSSGHLVFFSKIFGIQESLFVSILLHFATLLSVCVVMRKEILYLIKHPFSKEMMNLIISTIVSFFIVLLIYDFAKHSYIENYLSLFFMITACVLFITDIFISKKQNIGKLNKKSSLIMGIAQGFAVFPGISRSGATICAGLLAKGEKEEVAKHSFVMSLPIILASLVMEFVELGGGGALISIPIFPMIFAFLLAFIVGVISLRLMIKLTCKVKFRYFAFYLVVLSVISLFV